MKQKQTSLCFTGHRNLPKDVEQIKEVVLNEVNLAIEQGINTFYFGGCRGFDLLCAKVLIKLKQKHDINLIAVLPFEEQAKYWSEYDRELYYNTLPLCDEVITLSTHYTKTCYHERNRYMVDHSSKLIAYYNGSPSGTSYTLNYAKKQGLQIINIYNQ